MYNNLLFAVKNRILDEVVDTFNKHPIFRDKIKVVHKFPYLERVQYGVCLRNSSASLLKLAPDNYMGETKSHVALARALNFPGYSIEWVREDAMHVTTYQENEDVSSQLGPTQRMFFTANKPIVSGLGNTTYADNFAQVVITINGQEVYAEYVNGEKGLVLLSRATNIGDVVKISYYYKSIAPAGRYYVDFTEDTQFQVRKRLDVEDEVLFENTTGTETTAVLANLGVAPTTLDLFLKSRNGGTPIKLIVGTDYTFAPLTSTVTFLIPLLANYKCVAEYQYDGGTVGPFTFASYQEINNAIPGVIISIGRRAQKGDKQVILVSENREPMAQVFGGHWNMAMNLGVIAKDPMQLAEMTDLLIEDFWATKKNMLEFQGITMTSIEPTGETENVYDSLTGDMYYESSVDINIMTEWQKFVPFLWKIKDFAIDLKRQPTTNDYYVTKENELLPVSIETDTREVVKYPILGYERVV